jgi:hypothetical protein
MKLPALLHGTESEVDKRCRALEKSIAGGLSLAEALAGADELDTQTTAGLIVMEHPGLLSGSHYFPYLLPDQIAEGIMRDRINRKRERSLFEELLMYPWGVLGLLSMTVGARWTVRHRAWLRDLVRAIRRDWDILVTEGPRYTNHEPQGQQLYELPSYLGPALGYCGVPKEALRAVLTEGLAAALPYLKESL